jgi:hypothetical protein
MSEILWIVLAFGAWLAIISTMRVCAGEIKDSDRAQSELLAAERQARFVNPEPRRIQVGG